MTKLSDNSSSSDVSSDAGDACAETGSSRSTADSKARAPSSAMKLYKNGKIKLSEVQTWEGCMRTLVHQLPQIEAGSSFAVIKELTKTLPVLPDVPPPADDIHALQLRREGNIAIITINRPTKANAYNTDMLKTLAKLVEQFRKEHVAAVVFTSSDPRFWCAGADLERVANPGARTALFMQSQ